MEMRTLQLSEAGGTAQHSTPSKEARALSAAAGGPQLRPAVPAPAPGP